MSTNIDFKLSSLSHTGLIRTHNEDSVLVDEKLGLFLVADGMGGHLAGDVASQMVVRIVQEQLAATWQTASENPDTALRAVRDAFNAANTKIREVAQTDKNSEGMGSTLAMLLTRGQHAMLAHIGDSRIYRLRNHRLEALTRDHSLLQAQVGAGVISGEEARFSHNRNLVTRALGMADLARIDTSEVEIMRGDLFLICSDGLNTMVDDSDIELVLFELQANLPLAVRCLVEIANDNGGHDNVSLIAVRFDQPVEVTKPSWFARLLGWFTGR